MNIIDRYFKKYPGRILSDSIEVNSIGKAVLNIYHNLQKFNSELFMFSSFTKEYFNEITILFDIDKKTPHEILQFFENRREFAVNFQGIKYSMINYKVTSYEMVYASNPWGDDCFKIVLSTTDFAMTTL